MTIRTVCNLAENAHAILFAADKVTGSELQLLIGMAGRDYGPLFLSDADEHGKITPAETASVIGDIWSMAEYPDRKLGHDEWRRLFAVAGFTIDGAPHPQPTETARLYRGSVPERRADWSWTSSIDVALRYARGHVTGRTRGGLWVCDVPPAHMLAINTGRGEDETVVDTRGLDIREVTDEDAARAAGSPLKVAHALAYLENSKTGEAAPDEFIDCIAAMVLDHGDPDTVLRHVVQIIAREKATRAAKGDHA
ncbi:hypothetical protein ACWD4V_13970 [Streptomyces tsukubensis]